MVTNPQHENLKVDRLLAVFDSHDALRRAVGDLVSAGYPEPAVLTGEDGAQQIDARNESSGNPIARLIGMVEDHLSEATNYLSQYEEEARSGNLVLAVEVAGRDEAEPARQVLLRHGARNIRHFGKLAVADLSLPTNPSARSEESPEPQADT